MADPSTRLLPVLAGGGKSPNTLRLYLGAVDKLAQWVAPNEGPTDPRRLTRTDLALFLAAMSKEWRPSTCSSNFRSLQQLFGWLVREEELDRSPMERMRPPRVPEAPVPVPTDDQLRRLLASTDGRDFLDRRDSGIIRLLLDTGCRREEIAALTTTDVSLEERDITTLIGKRSRVRIVPFGLKTAQALGGYMRLRDRDRRADSPVGTWQPLAGRVDQPSAKCFDHPDILVGVNEPDGVESQEKR